MQKAQTTKAALAARIECMKKVLDREFRICRENDKERGLTVYSRQPYV